MKSVFDNDTREELYQRIDTLSLDSKPQWGKMTVAQMVRHCAICEEYYLGNIVIKRSFIGKIFGKQALKSILRDDTSTLGKNAPTAPSFLVTDTMIDLETEKNHWKSMIGKYENFPDTEFIHWFFGSMTRMQLGQFIYKHSDHHLRQFGA